MILIHQKIPEELAILEQAVPPLTLDLSVAVQLNQASTQKNNFSNNIKT